MRLGIYLRDVSSGQGTEKVATNLAIGLAKRGHAVDLLLEADAGRMRDELAASRVRVLDLRAGNIPAWRRRAEQLAALAGALAEPAPWRRAGGRGVRGLARLAVGDDAPIAALADYARGERPDALLSFLNYPNFVLSLAARRLPRGVRCVANVRNHVSSAARYAKSRWNRSTPVLMQRCLPLADAVVAPSRGVADDVAAITGMERDRIEVIYNPLWPDIPLLAREPAEHPWLARPEAPVLVAAGKLKPQKDFATLLQAFQRARAERPLRLIVLGEGELLPRLRARAEALGVAADVDFAGHVRNPYAFLARASLFVLSSAWEGLPNVLIEALACGCPVVSTDCPSGPAEILEGGRWGRLVPVAAPDALAAAILETLAAPPDPERLRARSRDFSLERALDGYEAALLGARPRT